MNETEKKILEIARKHFVQKGFAATRTQEIADEAGINKAMLHYYFRTKEKLYHEIIIQILDLMIPQFTSALTQEGSFWEKMEAFIDTYISILIERPEIPFFIMSELSQKQERFVTELKKRATFFPVAQAFILEMLAEMEAGKIKQMPPLHLFLNVLSMTVFPFIAKPAFCTVFDFPDSDFEKLMLQRKTIIIDFVKNALRVDERF